MVNIILKEPFLEIEKLIFGETKSYKDTNGWYKQGFTFSQTPKFGLLQSYGGPCGVLTAVQAFILKHLFFDPNENLESKSTIPELSTATIDQCLIKALAEILIICSNGKNSVSLVKIRKNDNDGEEEHSYDNCSYELTEETGGIGKVEETLKESLSFFKGELGVISLIFSAVMTKGVAEIKKDMDNDGETLVKSFGYCSQELVNLLITGRATSNVFDGQKTFDSTAPDAYVLKGVTKRGTVGFLSTLESTGFIKIGENLKTPLYPIWILGSMSHYTVVFSLEDKLVFLSPEDQLKNEIRSKFNTLDQFESGFIEYKIIDQLFSALKLPPVLEKLVEENLLETRDTNTLLFSELFNALVASRRKVWNCPNCTLVNLKTSVKCNACNASMDQSVQEQQPEEKAEPLKTAVIFHYNGMDSLKKESGDLARISIKFDYGYNFSGSKDTIRAVLDSKWPDSQVEFEADEKSIRI